MTNETLETSGKQPKPRRPDGDLVQSLMRALTLLEILADGGCRLKELSQRASLPPSTTHRLLTTLEQKRFVRFDRDESLWTIGSHCAAIAAGLPRPRDLLSGATMRIERLAGQLGATVNLGILEGNNLMLVQQANRPRLSPAQPTGTSLPVHATAMGKILLAGAIDTPQTDSLISGGLNRLTERTICDPAALARELRTVRIDGIATDNEESMAGRRCIAAPVRNAHGKCVAAISVTATRSQFTGSAFSRLGAMLAATAAEIGREIAV